jgi:hypothetical protein
MHCLQHQTHYSTSFVARLIHLFSYQFEIRAGSHTTCETTSYNFDLSNVLAMDYPQEVV